MPKRNNKTPQDFRNFLVRLPAAEYNRIRKIAFDNNEPIAAVVRRAIREMKGRAK